MELGFYPQTKSLLRWAQLIELVPISRQGDRYYLCQLGSTEQAFYLRTEAEVVLNKNRMMDKVQKASNCVNILA
jgi:hypothetical protein